MVVESVITHEDDTYWYGIRTENGKPLPKSNWMQLKEYHWTSQPLIVLLKKFDMDAKRIISIENFINGDINRLYYVMSLKHSEALNWLLGAISFELKENKTYNNNVNAVMSVEVLNCFVDYLLSNKFERTFAKDIFAELILVDKFINTSDISFDDWEKYEYNCIWPITLKNLNHLMDDIVKQEKYKAVDINEIDSVLQKVIANNASQAEKAKTDPRIINWFVGQCMKELKGKASALTITDKLKIIFEEQ